MPRSRLPLATLAALFVGYACSYFHRADLATLAPLWSADAARAGLRAALPDIASLGMLVYALGKMLGGLVAERIGARRLFVVALLAAGVAESVATQIDAPLPFAVCRVAGMVLLGCAWPALGHVVASVTPPVRLATVMAFLSQSYLVGDAGVRAVLAAVVANGGDARSVLGVSAAGLLFGAGVVTLLFWFGRTAHDREVKDLLPSAGAIVVPRTMRRLLLGLAAMNFGLAMVRETLSLWTPTMLVDSGAMAAEHAVRASALLPLFSGIGALVGGAIADRGPRAMLVMTLVPTLVGAAALALAAMLGASSLAAVITVLVVASMCLAIPMTLASGVLPLRGAKNGSARRLGLVDGAGSLGAVLAGGAIGRLQAAAGARGVFLLLAVVAALAALLAIAVHRLGAQRGNAA